MLNTFIENSIDRIGDRNPQLWRELKERLILRNAIAAIAISLSFQVFTLAMDSSVRAFFTNGSIIWIGILAGIYLLIADINREFKQGTINFIQLTPISGKSLFLGKLFGVPCLIYLIALSLIPVDVFQNLTTGVNIGALLLWYLTFAAIVLTLFSGAIFYALVGNRSAIIGVIVFLVPLSVAWPIWELVRLSVVVGASLNAIKWYGVSLNSIGSLSLMTIGVCLFLSYWIWIGIDRQYAQPKDSILEKRQIYGYNLTFCFWLLGFAIHSVRPAMPLDDLVMQYYIILIFMGLWIGISQIWITQPASFDRYRGSVDIDNLPENDPVPLRNRVVKEAVEITNKQASEEVTLLLNCLVVTLIWFGYLLFYAFQLTESKSFPEWISFSVATLMMSGVFLTILAFITWIISILCCLVFTKLSYRKIK
jgi:hypothetical protein